MYNVVYTRRTDILYYIAGTILHTRKTINAFKTLNLQFSIVIKVTIII